MNSPGDRNRIIVVNTVFLYFRMILLMFISFYTSRVLLQKLGVEDYGIYNVVGGIVAMFSSLRSIFASSSQRFFNVAIGKGDEALGNKVFNVSILINVLVCVVFLLLTETIGLWFLKNEINIPRERLQAALVVYQFSIATSIVTILNTTFDALIIAHEKLKFYSYISLLEGVLKLLILYMLVNSVWDKLILYSFLLLCVSVIVFIISIVYSYKRIGNCGMKFCADRALIKEMSVFSGWNFFGNLSYSIVNEGINFLLNIFGGVVLNAARGIAYQVRNAIMQFQSNLLVAVHPQVIQSFSMGDENRFYGIIYLSSKISFYLFLCLAIPAFIWIEDILRFWLGTIPNYTVVFVRSILLYLLVRSFHGSLDLYFKAAGQLKRYQLTELITLSMPVLLSYILLKLNCPYYSVFLVMGMMEIVNWILIIRLINRGVPNFINRYVIKVILPSVRVLGVSLLVIWLQYCFVHLHFIFEILIAIVLIVSVIYSIGLESVERHFVNHLLYKK